VKIRNLTAIATQLQARLAELGPGDEAALAQLASQAHTIAGTVEALCAERGATAAELPTPSRRAFQWLKFLSDADQAAAVLDALALARSGLAQARWPRRRALAGCPVRVEFYPMAYLYRMRPEARRPGATVRVTFAPGYLYAPPDVLEALLRAALGYGRAAPASLHAYALGADFAETTQSLELVTEPPPGSLRGAHYDLDLVFARVNAAYFANQLPRPRLTWSSTIGRRLLGYYQHASDRLMISRVLDDRRVPASVIDLVMYHELLHKRLGVQVINGRHCAHTEAFHAAERQFNGYVAAKEFLDRWSAANGDV
jgi:hypothetical protein